MNYLPARFARQMNTKEGYFRLMDLSDNPSFSKTGNGVRERLEARLKTDSRITWMNVYLFSAILVALSMLALAI